MTCENFDFMRSLHIGLVTHHWTGSYLKKPYFYDLRKHLRIISKKVLITTSDWAGIDVWCSPIVPLAPPVFRLT